MDEPLPSGSRDDTTIHPQKQNKRDQQSNKMLYDEVNS
jgi:hypothetical protein